MSKILHFQRAARQGSHVLVGLYGFSGSGKTYSALKLARGLVGKDGKIAVIDTETGRSLIYANVAAPWDYAELTSPFSPERYVAALSDVEEGGYDVAIIDSFSHVWDSIGGVLELADANQKLKGLVRWASPKAKYKKLVQAILRTRCHIIVCLRAKEKMKQEKIKDPQSGEMKDAIVSAGFFPISEKNFIYEVTVQAYLPNEGKRGIPVIEKCPEDLLAAFPAGEQIGEQTGARIRAWIDGAAPVDRTFEKTKREAEDAADEGMVPLRNYWYSLTPEQKRPLKPFMENLKSIAAEADRRMAEERRPETGDEPDPFPPSDPGKSGLAPPADAQFDDPFGLPPVKAENQAPTKRAGG